MSTNSQLMYKLTLIIIGQLLNIIVLNQMK